MKCFTQVRAKITAKLRDNGLTDWDEVLARMLWALNIVFDSLIQNNYYIASVNYEELFYSFRIAGPL